MKQNLRKAHPPNVKKPREDRAMLASRFRVLCSDAGLSLGAVAKTLHVTPRTVRYWFSGKSAVPYAAYKLWTPEGIPIAPEDGGWWSLLVRQARCFRTLYQRSADFERALMMLTAKGLAASDPLNPSAIGEDVAARRATRAAGGRGDGAARPGQRTGRREAPPNLLLEHFGTREGQKGRVSLEKRGRALPLQIPQHEIGVQV